MEMRRCIVNSGWKRTTDEKIIIFVLPKKKQKKTPNINHRPKANKQFVKKSCRLRNSSRKHAGAESGRNLPAAEQALLRERLSHGWRDGFGLLCSFPHTGCEGLPARLSPEGVCLTKRSSVRLRGGGEAITST